MSNAAIADRYARAVFELGVETGQLERLSEQIRSMARVYGESADLRATLDNPLVEEDARQKLLVELSRRLGLGELAVNTIKLLAQRRRLSALPDIARRLGTLADEKAGIVRAVVTSAAPLSEATYDQLAKKLESVTSRKIVIERKQDPSLIGGIVTRIGDNTIDGSIKGRLDALERQLLS
ncbi:MAG: ATP synthase F1 subunit delta [Myxococcales bacterium]|nr:ATP synthase F1 subunit delta [Myxococcales bacterium]MCB9578966.1 ATP synthase F1 subunit delta [Polyangiaceae bacterium]